MSCQYFISPRLSLCVYYDLYGHDAIKHFLQHNEDKSAGCVCHQVAAWVTDIFCNFYLEKNYKFANNSTTASKAREKQAQI